MQNHDYKQKNAILEEQVDKLIALFSAMQPLEKPILGRKAKLKRLFGHYNYEFRQWYAKNKYFSSLFRRYKSTLNLQEATRNNVDLRELLNSIRESDRINQEQMRLSEKLRLALIEALYFFYGLLYVLARHSFRLIKNLRRAVK